MRMNRLRRIAFATLLAFVILSVSACEHATDSPPVGTAPADAAPSLPPLAQPSATPGLTPQPMQLPQIDSSTARIPITAAIHALFTEKYGYTGPKPLESKTHGAWLNLADGTADIVFLVAPTQEELAYFTEKGVDIEMKVYGFDGLVFIGNESNPVKNLKSGQIRDIYSGKIKNWNQIGGENADILVYIRNAESGSQRLFESLVWAGYNMPDFASMRFREGEIDPTVTQRETTIEVDDDMRTVTRRVLLNQYSIGFNIMSYIDSAFRNAGLRLFSVDGYAPTTENFASGNYPYLTTSYVAIRADSSESSPARQLYDWMGSGESRELIANNSTLTVVFSESVCIRTAVCEPIEHVALAGAIRALNQREIRRQELLQFTLEEIGYLRNGVYALSGKIFQTKEYARYFSAQDWYRAAEKSDSRVTEQFNDYQKKNLEIILAYEKELKRALANR